VTLLRARYKYNSNTYVVFLDSIIHTFATAQRGGSYKKAYCVIPSNRTYFQPDDGLEKSGRNM